MPKKKGLHKKKKSNKKSIRKPLFLFAIVFACSVLSILFYYWYLSAIISDHFQGRRWDIPSRVYSDSFRLYPGLDIKQSGFINRLKRLSYIPQNRSIKNPGEYYYKKNTLEVYFHAFHYPSGKIPSRPIRMQLDEGVIVKLFRMQPESEIFSERLEPELIAEFFGESREERLLVKLEKVPTPLQMAVVSVEDKRFFDHKGVDLRAIGRAFLVNIKAGGISQGGSTLTQQLVKNFFLTPKRSYIRKFNEAMMALIVEKNYSKEDILEAYLNEVYMGQKGSIAIHGVGEAAKYYFGKEVHKLTVGECALIAALLKGPAIYSPYRNPEKARERQKVVLSLMEENGFIDHQQYTQALSESLPIKRPYIKGRETAYFVDLVRRQMISIYPEKRLTWEGLRIFTSIDVEMQSIMSEELKKHLTYLERSFPALIRNDGKDENDENKGPLQAAAIIVQPQTGFILSLSGGRDFSKSQFNRVIQSKRQPGSIFKPIISLAAFMSKRNDGSFFTPQTELLDEAVKIETPGAKIWEPENYDKKFRGSVSLRTSVERSINIPMIRLAQEVGISRVIETAHRLGIESELQEVPSLALGTSEVSPIELARAFSTIASLGVRPELLSVRDVVTQDGRVLEKRRMRVEEVVPSAAAYLVVQLMKGVVESGTARGIKNYGILQPMAGKTGTTSDFRDAWFVGFTPDLLGLVWVGFDDNTSIQLPGSQAALPIWAGMMRRILGAKTVQPFVDPPGVIRVAIDQETQEKATPKCPLEQRFQEIFISGTEPQAFCHLHPDDSKKKKGLWKKFRGMFSR